MAQSSNYMGSGFAQTLDQKPKGMGNLQGVSNGLQAAASATSLTLSNYAVPSMDGKLIPAIPIKLALKNNPPTLAVVYQMKDAKTGRMKKYIHEIKVNFEKQENGPEVNVNSMCDEICRKETTYLNPAFISRQQVLALLKKLHQNHLKSKEQKQNGLKKTDEQHDNSIANPKGRKPNFLERKRFVNYGNPEDQDQKLAEDTKSDTKVRDSDPTQNQNNKILEQQNELPAKPAATEEVFEVEEEVFSKPAAKKSKPEAVKSAAPSKKTKTDNKNEDEIKPDQKQVSTSKDDKAQQKKEKTDSYSDEWGDNDIQLEDKAETSQNQNKQQQAQTNALNDAQKKDNDFFNVEEDPILNKQPDDNKQSKTLKMSEKYDKNEDFFLDEFNDLDLEKEFNNNQMLADNDQKKSNPFGQSITKELLQQSKKEIEKDGFSDVLNSKNNLFEENDLNQNDQNKAKNQLQIEINETDNIAEQDDQAQQMLLENMMKNENKIASNINEVNGNLPNAEEPAEDDDDEEQYTEEGIIQQFDEIYNSDPALQQLLGDQPSSYTVEEKLSIIQAYKKGGGVQGLAEIIDDEDDEDQQNAIAGLAAGIDVNNAQLPEGMQYQVQDDNEEEEMDIDLENPEDVKIIESEFQKLYDNEEKFKNDFGEEMFELSPLQKYQIIDAYNKNGMDAVMALLNQTVDNSQNASAMMQQLDMQGQLEGDESVIWHQDKRYTRIQIEGLREDDDEYLMDDEQNIYSLDFKFITNMGEHQIENDDGDLL